MSKVHSGSVQQFYEATVEKASVAAGMCSGFMDPL